jgi:iron complex outermembrane recepter protein
MKKLLFILSIILFQYSFAQRNPVRTTLTGKFTDVKTKMSLESASIYISDLKKGTTADSSGNYTLANIPTGTYVVEVGHVGYKTIIRKVSFTENRTENFVLESSITEEAEVVVTGTSKAMSIKKSPVPIVSLSRQYLQQNLSTNIIDALSKVPGINAVTTGPNVSKPFIRGLGFNRILTLYDGVRQEGQQWGDEHGIEVDQNDIDKIEVVKGPASLIYGSDAVAGVVNLIPANPPLKGQVVGNILNEYQTNNKLISNSASLSGNTNNFVWKGRLSSKLATNYQNKIDGRVYNTGFHETDASALIGINRAWGYERIGFSYYDNLQEIPEGARDSATRKFTKQIYEDDSYEPIVSDDELNSYEISTIHQHIRHTRLYNSSSFLLGKNRIATNLSFQQSHRQEFSHPEDAPVPGLDLLLKTLSYDVKYYFLEKKDWSVTAGVNGMYQDNNVEKGTEFIIPSFHQFDIGPFVYVSKTINKLELAGGLRYDNRTFNSRELFIKPDAVTGFDTPVYGADIVGADKPFSAAKHNFSGVSGSLGMSYQGSKQVTFKANIGRGFRAPNITEISSNGIHPGTNLYQIGNADFKPEFNLQEDIGIIYNTPHVTLNAEIFYNNITNYIYNQKLLSVNGGDSVIVDGNQTFKFLQGKAQLFGGELNLDIHPHPLDWLHFENSLSVVYGTNKGASGQKLSDSAKYLPFIPPLHTLSELRANIKKIGKGIANAFVKVQLEYYAAQNRAYLENGTETSTPGYTLFHAGIGTDIVNKKGKAALTISVMGNNIFDVAYQSHLNRLKYFEDYPTDPRGHHGIYNMGRNISFRINVPLNFATK